jgi:hypothetical protein
VLPNTTHYTVITSDGPIYEYAGRAEAIQGFHTLPPQEVRNGSDIQIAFPQFCYYHKVTGPSNVYQIDFFEPRMDEQGYQIPS